jgi:hypothetical protein
MRTNLLKSCLIALAALAITCDSDIPTQTGNQPNNQPPDLTVTPRENSEAEIAAMMLSHEIIAPQWLYERIRADFDSIRVRFGDSLPVRSIKFIPLWKPGSIGAEIILSVLDDSTTGGRRMFDSLGKVYRMDDIGTFTGDSVYATLNFVGILNSVCLVDIFSKVPGMRILYSNVYAGDHSEIYIWPNGREFLYFFREAWGDCPAGCIYSKYHYFRSVHSWLQQRFEYVGSYQRDYRHSELAPPWYDTAKMARDTTKYWKIWYADSSALDDTT